MALFTAAEFLALAQIDEVADDTFTLLQTLITGMIGEIVGDTFDPDTAPVTVKAIALEAVVRAYTNPQRVESQSRAIDDFTTTDRWSVDGLGLSLTADERAQLEAAYGVASGAFSVRPYYEPPTSPIESWA